MAFDIIANNTCVIHVERVVFIDVYCEQFVVLNIGKLCVQSIAMADDNVSRA